MILFFIFYGITGTVALIAAIYLLLRRGNAFAADIKPPLRLRRWAAAFFGVLTLAHAWWLLFFIFSGQPHSAVEAAMHPAWYGAVNVLDCVALLTTIAGTLLAMLQDRRRSVWPVVAAMVPFVALGAVFMLYPMQRLLYMAFAYLLLVYVAFTIYMIVAVGQYGRWLHDNYADLERKEVRLSHVVALASLMLVVLYSFINSGTAMLFLLHFFEMALSILLLWRVETLPQLTDNGMAHDHAPGQEEPTRSLATGGDAISAIEHLLAERCVATQLYLQHDMTLVQLAKALGTNRTYLGQYFSGKGTTYNAYINDLRINHFVSLYREAAGAGRPVTAQQLALESGYRSYSTFSAAFKQRMGCSVAAWMHEATNE